MTRAGGCCCANGDDQDASESRSVPGCCSRERRKGEDAAKEGGRRRKERLTFNEFLRHPKTWLVINTFIMTPVVLYLYEIMVVTITDPLAVMIVFCVVALFIFVQMIFHIVRVCRLPPNYVLFNCITVPRYSSMVAFQFLTLVSVVTSVGVSAVYVSNSQSPIGSFGQKISVDEGTYKVKWAYTGRSIMTNLLLKYAYLLRVCRVEDTMRRGWTGESDNPYNESCQRDGDCSGTEAEIHSRIAEERVKSTIVNSGDVAQASSYDGHESTSSASSMPPPMPARSVLTMKTKRHMLRRVAMLVLLFSLLATTLMFKTNFSNNINTVQLLVPFLDYNAGHDVRKLLLYLPTGYPATDSFPPGPVNPDYFYTDPNDSTIIYLKRAKSFATEVVRIYQTDAYGQNIAQATIVFESNAKKDLSLQLICEISTVAVVWMLSVLSFSAPLLSFVVKPLEKVTRLFYLLRFDPLATLRVNWFEAPKRSVMTRCWQNDELEGIETSRLIRALLRLAELLAVALGPTGTIFYKSVVSQGGKRGATGRAGGLNLKGVNVSAIFLFCDIRNFTDTTEILQGDVFRWINGIATVVHGISYQYSGNAAKHVGDAFLLVWSLPLMEAFDDNDDEAKIDAAKDSSDEAQKLLYRGHCKEQAEKCLLAVAKMCIALTDDSRFLEPISAASQSALISANLSKVNMGFGIHAGNAIQGAIGSHLKVDVTFVSKSTEVAEDLESKTKFYGVPILMSGKFFNLLSAQTKVKCRKVDFDNEVGVDVKNFYTFDVDLEAEVGSRRDLGSGQPSSPSKRGGDWDAAAAPSKAGPPKAGGSNALGVADNREPYDPRIWVSEPSLRNIRRKFNNRFLKSWNAAFLPYSAQDYKEALEKMTAFDEEYNDSVAKALSRKIRKRVRRSITSSLEGQR